MNIPKKILIIDDEQSSLNSAFEFANDLYFNGELSFEFKPKSQDVPFSSLAQDYEMIFVDITLAQKSEMDGYEVLKKILNENLFPSNKLIILTANSQIDSELDKHGIDKSIKIEYKPTTFKRLRPILEANLTR